MALLGLVAIGCRGDEPSGAGERGAPPPGGAALAQPSAAAAARAPAAATPGAAALAALPGEIVFVSERDGRAEVHAVRPDGSARRVVAAAADADLFPTGARGPRWLLAIRTTGGESEAHREELVALTPAGIAGDPILAAGRLRNPSQALGAGWLAVESDRESMRDIYRVPLAGGPPRRLTDSQHGNFEPAVSPDGRLIAFTSSRDGNAEIYVMDADGKDEVRLTAFHRDDWGPVWSPDGQTIVFLSAREGPARLFVMRPDGTEQRHLLAGWGPTGVPPDAPGSDSRPGVRWRDGEVEEESPAVSPDGARIALVVRRADGGGEVWVADVRTGRRRAISPPGARDSSPAWSPDGRHVVFASAQDGQSDLFVAPVERGAGGPVRVTFDPGQEWLPRWVAAGPAALRASGASAARPSPGQKSRPAGEPRPSPR